MKLFFHFILLFLSISQATKAEDPTPFYFKCLIKNLANKKEYFGRLLINAPVVRIIAYEKNAISSPGFILSYQLSSKFQSTIQNKIPLSFPSVKMNFSPFDRIGYTNWVRAHPNNLNSADGIKISSRVELLNEGPWSPLNYANRLRIISNPGGANEALNLVFKDFEEINGWTLALVMAIVSLAVPFCTCYIMLISTDKKNKTAYNGAVKFWSSVTPNTTPTLSYFVIINIRASISLFSAFPYQVMFANLNLFFTIVGLCAFRLKTKTTYPLQARKKVNRAWLGILAVTVLVCILLEDYYPYLIFVGNLVLFWDVYLMNKHSLLNEYSITLSSILIGINQLPVFTLFFLRVNLWFTPTMANSDNSVILFTGGYVLLMILLGCYRHRVGSLRSKRKIIAPRTQAQKKNEIEQIRKKELVVLKNIRTKMGLLNGEDKIAERKIKLEEKIKLIKEKRGEIEKKRIQIRVLEGNVKGLSSKELLKMKMKEFENKKKQIQKKKDEVDERKNLLANIQKEPEDRMPNYRSRVAGFLRRPLPATQIPILPPPGRQAVPVIPEDLRFNYPQAQPVANPQKADIVVRANMIGNAVPLQPIQGYDPSQRTDIEIRQIEVQKKE